MSLDVIVTVSMRIRVRTLVIYVTTALKELLKSVPAFNDPVA